MDSRTISHIRNIRILINLSLNKKRDKRRQNLFAQNSVVKISSSPKIRKIAQSKNQSRGGLSGSPIRDLSPNLATLLLGRIPSDRTEVLVL